MLEELIHFVDRQFQFLNRQSGEMFIRELRRTLDALRREPRLAAIFNDERREAIGYQTEFEQHCTKSVDRLKELRQRFVTLVPEHDDSATPRPEDFDTGDNSRWHRSLAAFDYVAGREGPDAIGGAVHDDQSRPAQLSKILYRKIRDVLYSQPQKGPPQGQAVVTEPMRESLSVLNEELAIARRDHVRAWRIFTDAVLTSSGASLLYLEAFYTQLDSTVLEGETLLVELIRSGADLPEAYMMTKFLYERPEATHDVRKELDEAVSKLKAVAERVYQGFRMRIGTTRSLLAIFERFKVRCEWHDRRRLLEIAQGAMAPAGTGRRSNVEAVLTEELARYLFDQGLNPITEVPTAGLRPDVLGERLYVEAKQYSDSNPRKYLVRGIHQMNETMGRLWGSNCQVREAFYVVFRLGGGLVQMPSAVRREDWTIYPRVIDLAPADVSGSRAQQSIGITEEELRARVEE
ncbi:hypothetical protein JRI60_17630 [Archangium violaceum]|uniref:hypothetical protein n=1 Tax=Archangium violaceum TaxID=83451 RepID=UPI0019515019|nr:hypothetical protein [Archangium violaceum]QRO00718.1 hypothetical protein JRI60_17630 [Archangium violaceum]